MDDVTLVGIDLGKHSFHLRGQDAKRKGVFRKKMSRKQLVEFFATFHACTVVMEACAGSHHMARKLAGFGHTVRLISPQFVRRCDLRSSVAPGDEIRNPEDGIATDAFGAASCA